MANSTITTNIYCLLLLLANRCGCCSSCCRNCCQTRSGEAAVTMTQKRPGQIVWRSRVWTAFRYGGSVNSGSEGGVTTPSVGRREPLPPHFTSSPLPLSHPAIACQGHEKEVVAFSAVRSNPSPPHSTFPPLPPAPASVRCWLHDRGARRR